MKDTFIKHASDTLGDTDSGLTGSKIIKFFSQKSFVYDIEIPHHTYPIPLGSVPNKRTAIYENIKEFETEERYEIIRELCDHEQIKNNLKVIELKNLLIQRYGRLAKTEAPEIAIIQVEEDKHFLRDFPKSKKLYSEGLTKYQNGFFQRNTLDDMRLSLELFLKELLGNSKSLENQFKEVGVFAKSNGLSSEAVNMFQKLLDYYSKYQNQYVKHNDNVNIKEVEFVINQTSTFMQLFVQ